MANGWVETSRARFRLQVLTALAALAALALGGLCWTACTDGTSSTDVAVDAADVDGMMERPPIPALRGVVLVSIDTLRADHVGAYGYPRDTSPRLDALAAESVVFEAAIAQAPSTLTSHLALFTSLFPSQFFPLAEGPVPPEGHSLSPEIATFPESFHAAGFRTAGHSEGGYVSRVYGFSRGFEEWTDPPSTASTDIEVTVERGLEFLRRMAEQPDERFFLFLHTYSVHDPYEPPEAYRGLFTGDLWTDDPPTRDPPTARTLLEVNAGKRPTSEEEARYFEARYDEGIRYADEALGRLWDGLAELGFEDDVAVVVTADHGEEFLEHGRYLHTQLYPEQLHVPLVVRIPGVAPARVATPVRSIDVAPTLLDLVGLEPLPQASGRSLLALLGGDPEQAEGTEPPENAWAPICAVTWDSGSLLEMLLQPTQSHQSQSAQSQSQSQSVGRGSGPIWALRSLPAIDPGGAWISDVVSFDVPFASTDKTHGHEDGALRLLAFHDARTIRLTDESGDVLLAREVPAAWVDLDLPTRALGRRLRLQVDGCASPKQLGLSSDPRCLGVQMARPVLQHREYYLGFPEASLAPAQPGPIVGRRLEVALARCMPPRVADSTRVEPFDADRQALCALGYLSEEECSMESE